MQALFIPSYANSKPLKYYDNKNRIMIAYANPKQAKKLIDEKIQTLDKTITRIILREEHKPIYSGFDTYKCDAWVYPGEDLSHIEITDMQSVMNYGDSFLIIDHKEAFLHVPNTPIIDVDFAIEIQ